MLQVTTAEYRATCACCTTFRTQIDGIEPKARYDNNVREAVTAADQRDLAQLLQVAPRLRVLREFVAEMHQLVERGQTEAMAWRRHEALLSRAA
jgi:phage antirepressor YoqD-like protein